MSHEMEATGTLNSFIDNNLFIEKIENVPELQKAITKMQQSNRSINLACKDWKEKLHGMKTFQALLKRKLRFSKGFNAKQDKVIVKTIVQYENRINVIVAGLFSLENPEDYGDMTTSKGGRLVVKLCSPLSEIGQAMKEDPDQKLLENCKFFIETCNPYLCIACKKAMVNINGSIPNCWCVLKTKIYDGESVKHQLRPVVESMFKNQTFMAIANISITSKYMFGDNSFKIAGTCRDMVLFKESTLENMEELNLDLSALENLKAYPAITLPPEDDTIIEGIPDEVVENMGKKPM